ncbi:Glutamate--cysteine ligase catalytic subunit [Halotydeus destructor]|nr:Glutamate--cysteine ligase catalytic subunit [Halotydeus destructor]
MGLLSQGRPLNWEETKKYAEHVRRHGIVQFINLYKKNKDREDGSLKWGDEVEYMIVKLDKKNRLAQASLRAEELLQVMDKREAEEGPERTVLWRPEFGSYMIEGTPGHPYGECFSGKGLLSNFISVEPNMRLRRQEIEKLLPDDEMLLTLTSFPRLGCPGFTFPKLEPDPANSLIGSQYFPDEAIFGGHPRFKTLAQNIRSRRGRKVIIDIPVFKDVNTPDPFCDAKIVNDDEAKAASKADQVYMDCMGFGMGCCCLQVTFLASNLMEARILYDQLNPLCPVFMALSAASPVHKGYLTDRDCRWAVISQSVDDRTKEELGEEPLKNGKYRISKSRYDSIDMYISPCGEKYNDLTVVHNEEYLATMVEQGVDPLIAKHISHLFIRDPISVYLEKLDQDDENETDHFENIQSTNWQTMRFKPPPANSSIGWRVEFRPMEVQITDFENSAYVVFVVLLTRLILSYKLNLLIPISKVDENMLEAQKRDSVKRSRLWFRNDIITQLGSVDMTTPTRVPDPTKDVHADESCTLMTINEIINGKDERFPGLVPLLKQYLLSMDVDAEAHCAIHQYLNLISSRASGKYSTTAQWIREFVRSHPDYKGDSVVSEAINFDLNVLIAKITKGQVVPKELVGDNPITVSKVSREA